MKTITTELMKRFADRIFKGSCGSFHVFAFLTIMMALLPCVSFSATYTWKGTGGNNNWGTSSNWDPDVSNKPTAGDTARFDGTGINLNTDNSTRTLGALLFTAGQTNTVVINTRTNAYINFNASGKHITVAAGNHKIIGNGDSGTFYDIQFTGPSTNDISPGASFEIQGRIKSVSTSDNYTKIGGGTLILSGNSSGSGGWNFSNGGFYIQDGALRFTAATALGNGGNKYIVSSGAAVEVAGGLIYAVGAGTWTLNGTGVNNNGALRSISGTNTLSTSSTGMVVLASASSIGVDSGSQLTVSRVISGANSLTKVGVGTLLLTTTNTYTGATIVEAGTFALGKTNAISASSAVTLSGGTLDVGVYSNALTSLTLEENSTIALGDGTGTLSFTGGSGEWSGTLSLEGTLGEKTLRFGTDANGLAASQQAQIKWNGFSTKLNSQGYVIPLRGTVLLLF